MINFRLGVLEERAAEFVLVPGDPKYYTKAVLKTGHQINPPYASEYPEAWLALELKKSVLDEISGTVQCAAPLNFQEHR